MESKQSLKNASWLEKPVFSSITLNWEIILYSAILLLAFLSRFYELGLRVMSHDETSHVYFAWQLFRGNGYAHSALTHGPLQFHLIALSYYLFGDNDFTARIPMALFSIATVGFAWNFRRYLGRVGAVVAAALFLITPYMLFYGRYARNEVFVGLFGLVTLWAILRYLDRGEDKYLYFLTAATALHFASKETSFIYTAQALLFLGFLFLIRVRKRNWGEGRHRQLFFFFLFLTAGIILLGIGSNVFLASEAVDGISATEVVEPVVPGDIEESETIRPLSPMVIGAGAGALLTLLLSLFYLIRGYGWARLREERSFSLMLLLGTLILPHLSAFPITLLGRDPLNYSDTNNLYFIIAVVTILLAISAFIGMAWKRSTWLTSVAIFYVIFIPLFTTIFTNANGVFSGIVGSLGYWLEQQGVQRGNQPWYYYWGVQIPIYEYLGAIGTLLAARVGWGIWRGRVRKTETLEDSEGRNLRPGESRKLALYLMAFWMVSSLIAYTIAGEKMPWLTYHIALPMILLSGWAFGRLIKQMDWSLFRKQRHILAMVLMTVVLLALVSSFSAILGTSPPFQGPEQAQLINTYNFIFRVIVLIASIYGLSKLLADWKARQVGLAFTLLSISGLALLTARASFRANYINYDDATEFLVYAHMGRGPKEVIEQIEDISQRINDGNTMVVAYDNETSYPFWWYLRNFPNNRFFGETPSRDLREVPVIIVGDTNYGKIEPVVGDAFYKFEYIRIWWPNQDYFDFTRDSISFDYTARTGQSAEEMSTLDYASSLIYKLWEYIGNAEMRAALFDIWVDRDYEAYFQINNQTFDITKWSPARTMRMYVRKDVVAQIWDYGVEPIAEIAIADPYENLGIELASNLRIGGEGAGDGQFNLPRGIALAPDGSIYIADSGNNRIQHMSADGDFENSWGTFADLSSGAAAGGTFFEPWGVAVSPGGDFVYVADTWNHRVQKFTAQGRFIREWGVFGQGDDPFFMWGPRDVAVDGDGNVLVMDTGNKRVKVYDADGNFISQFGQFGFELGSFDEPVGLALDDERGRLYIADTWNQRVQVLSYTDGIMQAIDEWSIAGWYGQSLENKPYLSVGANGRVYISDPESGRVLVYEADGSFVNFWGGFDQSEVSIVIAQGIAADELGNVWLSDSQEHQILRFNPE